MGAAEHLLGRGVQAAQHVLVASAEGGVDRLAQDVGVAPHEVPGLREAVVSRTNELGRDVFWYGGGVEHLV